jgi:hypothetical protein
MEFSDKAELQAKLCTRQVGLLLRRPSQTSESYDIDMDNFLVSERLGI